MNRVMDEKRFISCCFAVPIVEGTGFFSYPAELRHDIMVTFCRIVSLKATEPLSPSKSLFAFCDVSYFRDRDQVPRYNVLQNFDSAITQVQEFNGTLFHRLNICPDQIKMYVNEFENGQYTLASWSGLMVVELFGYRQKHTI